MQKWEYCILACRNLVFFKAVKDRPAYWECDLAIEFIGVELINEMICSDDVYKDEDGKKYTLVCFQNPFREAIGKLGSIGWELIDVPSESENAGIAHFKRSVEEDRNINEPKLALSIERWYI